MIDGASSQPISPQPVPSVREVTREEMIHRITTWQAEHGHKRRYGTGSIFQAKNGTWYGFITVSRDKHGKRIRKKLTGRTREEVQTKLDFTAESLGIGSQQAGVARPLGNRSDAQLKRMFEQAQSGERSYRSGRGPRSSARV